MQVFPARRRKVDQTDVLIVGMPEQALGPVFEGSVVVNVAPKVSPIQSHALRSSTSPHLQNLRHHNNSTTT